MRKVRDGRPAPRRRLKWIISSCLPLMYIYMCMCVCLWGLVLIYKQWINHFESFRRSILFYKKCFYTKHIPFTEKKNLTTLVLKFLIKCSYNSGFLFDMGSPNSFKGWRRIWMLWFEEKRLWKILLSTVWFKFETTLWWCCACIACLQPSTLNVLIFASTNFARTYFRENLFSRFGRHSRNSPKVVLAKLSQNKFIAKFAKISFRSPSTDYLPSIEHCFNTKDGT